MAHLMTNIAFPGNAREAFDFYHEVFGGDLDMMSYGEVGMTDMGFASDAIAHANLKLPGGTISGGDAMPGEDYPLRGTAYSLLIVPDSVQQGRDLITKILDGGGTEGMPFEKAPWGDYYGHVFDRFGVMWAFDAPAEDQ